MRGQHGAFSVDLLGETGRDDFEGRVGNPRGVAFDVRQADDDGIATVPGSTVEGLIHFISFFGGGGGGRGCSEKDV